MQGQALPQDLIGVRRRRLRPHAPPIRHLCGQAQNPLASLARAQRPSAIRPSAADEISASTGAPISASRNALTPAPMNSVSASSSQRLSINAGWPSAIERIMTSRAGRRALRPSLLCGASGASSRPTRGPRGGNGPPRRGTKTWLRAGIASRRPLAFVAEERRKAPLHVRLVVAAQRSRRRFFRPPRRGAARAPRAARACRNARHQFRA